MITDQQRREVAERLREEDKPALHENQHFMNVFEDFVAEATGVWDYRETRATPEGFNASCDLLADLIDRPTCRVDSTERWETAGYEHGVDYTLSCGHAATLGECDELRFCPVCGAEVVE